MDVLLNKKFLKYRKSMMKLNNLTGDLHAMKIRISSLLIVMLIPVAMIGQVGASASARVRVSVSAKISATITTFGQIDQIPDSADLHFRVNGRINLLMNLTVTNASGSRSTEFMASPSTDLFLPGRRTPGTEIIFNYY